VENNKNIDMTALAAVDGVPADPAVIAIEYKRNAGFAFVTDISHKVADMAAEMDLTPLEAKPQLSIFSRKFSVDISDSTFALAQVGHALSNHQIGLFSPDNLMAYFNISADDIGENNLFIFRHGIADQNFTWHFAAGVANSVASEFVTQGFITTSERESLALGDWADMIGSGWFSMLLHDLALAQNGLYGRFGQHGRDYQRDALLSLIKDNHGLHASTRDEVQELTRLFIPEWVYDETTDRTYLTATLQPVVRKQLREVMREVKSIGCPVARHAGALSLNQLQSDEHTKSLVENGHLTLGDVVATSNRQRFTQEYSPIDRSLEAMAVAIDRYDSMFGAPYRKGSDKISHKFVPSSSALVRNGKVLTSVSLP
jgi:hypothetical protein